MKDKFDDLRKKLKPYYPFGIEVDEFWGDPSCEFVELLMVEVYWAYDELQAIENERSKMALKDEISKIQKNLKQLNVSLQSLSEEISVHLMDDHRDYADQIYGMIDSFGRAEAWILNNPKSQRPVQKKSTIAKELAIRVLRVLQEYEIQPVSTYNEVYDQVSVPIQVLEHIGWALGLNYSPPTWRDHILEIKKIK